VLYDQLILIRALKEIFTESFRLVLSFVILYELHERLKALSTRHSPQQNLNQAEIKMKGGKKSFALVFSKLSNIMH